MRGKEKVLGEMEPNRLTGCREERGLENWKAVQVYGTGLQAEKHWCILDSWSTLPASLAPRCSSADYC